MRHALFGLLLALVCDPAQAADATRPHPHQGVVRAWSGLPPAVTLSSAQEAALGATGVTLLSCARPDGWQTVFHLHLHVLPRFPDDGLTIPWPTAPGDAEGLARTAERLRAAL